MIATQISQMSTGRRIALFLVAGLVAFAVGWLLAFVTAPPVPILPPFACHDTDDGPDPQVPVDLTDQFPKETVTVGPSELLCTPLIKRKVRVRRKGEPKPKVFRIRTGDHLLCYETDRFSMGVPRALTDQFGTDPTVRILDYKYFCEPADKNELD